LRHWPRVDGVGRAIWAKACQEGAAAVSCNRNEPPADSGSTWWRTISACLARRVTNGCARHYSRVNNCVPGRGCAWRALAPGRAAARQVHCRGTATAETHCHNACPLCLHYFISQHLRAACSAHASNLSTTSLNHTHEHLALHTDGRFWSALNFRHAPRASLLLPGFSPTESGHGFLPWHRPCLQHHGSPHTISTAPLPHDTHLPAGTPFALPHYTSLP